MHGLRRIVQSILSVLQDYWFDLEYGVETGARVKLDDLEIPSENKTRGVGYEGTRVRHFGKLMNMLEFPDDSVFVDFGSGKGRILLEATKYGFKRVVGVEFSHELCEKARENLFTYKNRSNVNVDVEIVESDAVDYEIMDDENVFFMFNPFDATILRVLLDNIGASLKKKHRKIWLIYNKPLYRSVIDNHQTFARFVTYTYGGGEFDVYVNRDP